jgi:hypothetical protein
MARKSAKPETTPFAEYPVTKFLIALAEEESDPLKQARLRSMACISLNLEAA